MYSLLINITNYLKILKFFKQLIFRFNTVLSNMKFTFFVVIVASIVFVATGHPAGKAFGGKLIVFK